MCASSLRHWTQDHYLSQKSGRVTGEIEAAIVKKSFLERWGEFTRQLWEPREGWTEVNSQWSPFVCCASRCLPVSLEKREVAGSSSEADTGQESALM